MFTTSPLVGFLDDAVLPTVCIWRRWSISCLAVFALKFEHPSGQVSGIGSGRSLRGNGATLECQTGGSTTRAALLVDAEAAARLRVERVRVIVDEADDVGD